MTRSCSEPRATLIAVGGERGTSGEDGVVSLRQCGIDRVGAKSFLRFLFFIITTGLVERGLVVLCVWKEGDGEEERRKGRKGGQKESKGRGKGRREEGRKEGKGRRVNLC